MVEAAPAAGETLMWWQFALVALAGFVTGSFAAQFKAGGIYDKANARYDEAIAARKQASETLDMAAEKLEAARQEKLQTIERVEEAARYQAEESKRVAQYVQIMGRSVRR